MKLRPKQKSVASEWVPVLLVDCDLCGAVDRDVNSGQFIEGHGHIYGWACRKCVDLYDPTPPKRNCLACSNCSPLDECGSAYFGGDGPSCTRCGDGGCPQCDPSYYR